MTEAQQLLVINAWFAADDHDGRLPEGVEEIIEFVDGPNCPQGASRDELIRYLVSDHPGVIKVASKPPVGYSCQCS